MTMTCDFPCDHKIYRADSDQTPTDHLGHHHLQQQQQQQQQQRESHIYQQQDEYQHGYQQNHQQQQSVSPQPVTIQDSSPLLHTNSFEQERLEQIRVARQFIDDIIDDCIPYIEKTAYIEVREKAPHLLDLETNPLWFLQYEKWNIWNAAKRIVKYWEWKYVAFGEDRTFRYIHDISGSGSLNEHDLMIIRTGMAALLPKDQYGSSVLLFNRYHTTDAIDWDTLDGTQKLRFTFFWFSKLVQDQYNNRIVSKISTNDDDDDGVGKVIGLYVILSFVKVPSRNFRDMVTEAMPLRFVNTYVIFYPLERDIFTLSRYIIPSFLKFHAPIVKFANLYPCCCSSPYDVADKMMNTITQYPSLLHKHGIPIEFGGTWSFDNFYQWFDYSTSINNHNRYGSNPTNFIEQHQQIQEQMSLTSIFQMQHDIPQKQHLQQHQHQQKEYKHQQLPQQNILFHKIDTINSMDVLMIDDHISDIDTVLLKDALMIDDHININNIYSENNDEMMMIPELIHLEKQHSIKSTSSPSPYWMLRHQLFGERSHLSPIDTDGGGTLCQDDLKILQTGCLMILPNTKIGQRVLLYDPSKDFTMNSKSQQWFNRHRRCFFHCISLLMESDSSTSSSSLSPSIEMINNNVSLVMLTFMNQSFLNIDSGKNIDTFVDILNLFPNIRIVRIHVFLEPVGMGWYSYQENAKSKAVQLFDTTNNSTNKNESGDDVNKNTMIHECDNSNDVTNLIEFHTLSSSHSDDDGMQISSVHENSGDNSAQLGEALSIMFQFEKQNLPVSLGGTFTYTCFQAWQEELLPSSSTTRKNL